MTNINRSEKIIKKSLPQSIANKCGDKEAPVTTFVANAFLPLDTAGFKHQIGNASYKLVSQRLF